MHENHSEPSADLRLVELISRSIRMRVGILGFTIVVILMIWSAIEAGQQRQAQIDAKFAQQEIEFLKEKGVDVTGLSNTLKGEQGPQIFSEMEKRIYSLVLSDMSEKGKQFIEERLRLVNQYEEDRRNAFRINVHVPYMKDDVALNARTLADIWPFCVMGTLLVVMTLGFKQRNYEVLLSLEREKCKTRSQKSRALALGEFLGGTVSKSHVDGQEVWLYKKPIALHPDSFLTAILVVVIMWLSLQLLGAYNPTIEHRTDDIFFTYYSLVWAALVGSVVILMKTKKLYAEELASAMGSRVLDSHFLLIHKVRAKITPLLRQLSRPRMPLNDLLTSALAVISLASLLLVWTEPKPILGYQFLRTQSNLSSKAGITFFPIDPPIFKEMRVNIAYAVLFSLVCVLHRLFRALRLSDATKLLEKIRTLMAFLLFYLAGNFLLYMGILQYESGTSNAIPILDLVLSPRGIDSPRGLPLLFYNPTWGFIVYFASNIALALLSAGTSVTVPTKGRAVDGE